MSSQLLPSTPNADGSLSLYGRDGVIIVDSQETSSGMVFGIRTCPKTTTMLEPTTGLSPSTRYWHIPPASKIREALVIGVGSGITLGTLATLDTVERIDAYDINQTLKRLLHAFPEGTLRVGTNPKVRLIWQDGPGGLALNSQQYDLITQQPLYLKQAGSSILL